jgi:hypothetical protein
LEDVFHTKVKDLKGEIQSLNRQTHDLKLKIQSTDDKFIEGHLNSQDYTRIKNRYDVELVRLRARIFQLETFEKDLDHNLKASLNRLTNIAEEYKAGNSDEKKKILGSIFPEKCREKSFSNPTFKLFA